MTATACDVGRATAGEGNAPETLARRLRTHLQVVAKQRVPITYQEAVNAVRLTAPNTIHQVTDALEHLMAEDAASGLLRLRREARTLRRRCHRARGLGVSRSRVQRGCRVLGNASHNGQ
jgi:hypothetical protein